MDRVVKILYLRSFLLDLGFGVLSGYCGVLKLFLNGVVGYGLFVNGLFVFVVLKFMWILCVVNVLNGLIVKVFGIFFLDSEYGKDDYVFIGL